MITATIPSPCQTNWPRTEPGRWYGSRATPMVALAVPGRRQARPPAPARPAIRLQGPDHLRQAWLRSRGIVPHTARRGIESSEKLGKYRWVIEHSMFLAVRLPPPRCGDRVSDLEDEIGGDVDTIDVGGVGLDVAHGHATRIRREDGVVEAVQAALSFADANKPSTNALAQRRGSTRANHDAAIRDISPSKHSRHRSGSTL